MNGAVLRLNGVTIPKRHYMSRHLKRMMTRLALALKPRQKISPRPVLSWGGFSGGKTAPRQLQKLIRLAAGNPYKNAYHHPWHSMSVVIHAALLADLARCDAPSRDQLLLAALCHDLDHRGKRVSRVPFIEERRAAVLAIRTSFGQGRGRDARALIAQIEATATAFVADQPMDEVTALLRDADIMASVFHPRNFALELTRGVMTEKGMAVTAHDGLTGFLKIMMQRGLSHAVTQHLATTMPSRLLGVGHHPEAAAYLGFRQGGRP